MPYVNYLHGYCLAGNSCSDQMSVAYTEMEVVEKEIKEVEAYQP